MCQDIWLFGHLVINKSGFQGYTHLDVMILILYISLLGYLSDWICGFQASAYLFFWFLDIWSFMRLPL
jgi:hypothetical protein